MKRLFTLLLLYSFTLLPSFAAAADVVVQYHVWYEIDEACPATVPLSDWSHWAWESPNNGCNFRSGAASSWLRSLATTTYPYIGPYADDAANVSDIYRYHIRLAKAAGITAFMASGFPSSTSIPENTLFINRILTLLQVASEENFKIGYETWTPMGTVAQFYTLLKSNIDTLNASPYSSALYKINGKLAVWFVNWALWDTNANILSNLINAKTAFYFMSSGQSIADLNTMRSGITGSSEITQLVYSHNPTTSGCNSHGDVSDRLGTMGTNTFYKASHVYPQFNNGSTESPVEYCLGNNGATLATFLTESTAGGAQTIFLESWNDFREMTAIEPGLDIKTWFDVGQELIYQGDPYKTLKQIAAFNGVSWVTPQLRCSIVDGVMTAAGITSCVSATSIARTGSCAAAATSCNLSAVSVGDLVLTFAYRAGSTTAPSAAANNTSIRTGSTNSGGNTASYRLSCRRATAGDVSSGVFTNATGVVSIAYEGTNVASTADCQTTGIGARGATGNGINFAKTSTTVSYQTLAMTKTDNTAWVVGFMGGSASSVCSPTSLTARTSAGTVRVSDTNTTVSSFATGTCTVTSETWMSETLEILPLPGPPPGDTAAPSVPASLTPVVVSSSQINLSWLASTDNVGVTEYRIERCAGVSCSGFTEIQSQPTTSFNNIGLLASTSYSYRVRAGDLAGNLSGYSSIATATTSAAGPNLTYTLDNFENDLRVGQPNSVGNLHNVWGFSCACTGDHEIVTSQYHDGTHGLESYFVSSGDNDWQMHFYTYTETLPGWADGWNLISRFANNPNMDPAGGTPAWINNRINRIRFWIKMPPGVAQPSPAHHNVEFGTFIRCSTCGFAEDGGNHYYHFVTAYYAEGQWQQVIIDEHPDHQRGGFGSAEWPDRPPTTPPSPGYTYWDLMTRFYIDMPYAPYLPKGSRVYVDGFELYEDTNPENTDQIRSITAVYIPSTNETRVAWTRRKDQDTVDMQVRYAFSDIFALGFANATVAPSGTFTPPCCNGNNNVLYSTTAINVTGQSNLYVAVKPANSSLFRQIIIPTTGTTTTVPATASFKIQ